jgi:hypothetical protein
MANDLMEVTYDRIQELRRRGLGAQANDLLAKWHESKENEKKQVASEIARTDRMKLVHFGVCIQCKSAQAVEGLTRCQSCLDYAKKYRKRAKSGEVIKDGKEM